MNFRSETAFDKLLSTLVRNTHTFWIGRCMVPRPSARQFYSPKSCPFSSTCSELVEVSVWALSSLPRGPREGRGTGRHGGPRPPEIPGRGAWRHHVARLPGSRRLAVFIPCDPVFRLLHRWQLRLQVDDIVTASVVRLVLLRRKPGQPPRASPRAHGTCAWQSAAVCACARVCTCVRVRACRFSCLASLANLQSASALLPLPRTIQ